MWFFAAARLVTTPAFFSFVPVYQRHRLTRSLAEHMSDPREDERVRHSVLSLFRQRIYQIIAGYQDANDADLLRHDPALQILAAPPLGEALGSQPTLSRGEKAPSA